MVFLKELLPDAKVSMFSWLDVVDCQRNVASGMILWVTKCCSRHLSPKWSKKLVWDRQEINCCYLKSSHSSSFHGPDLGLVASKFGLRGYSLADQFVWIWYDMYGGGFVKLVVYINHKSLPGPKVQEWETPRPVQCVQRFQDNPLVLFSLSVNTKP